MAQLSLLSVLANIVAGLALAGENLGGRFAFLSSFTNLRDNRTSVFTIGHIAVIVGVLNLVARSPGETVLVAGDLLPALGGVGRG